MAQGEGGGEDAKRGRAQLGLGGARAEFVASLGRKIEGVRGYLAELEANATNGNAKAELRKRLQSIASGAKMLHFEAIGRSIAQAIATLDSKDEVGEQPCRAIAQILDELPAQAWSEREDGAAAIAARESAKLALAFSRSPDSIPPPANRSWMHTALIFGGDAIADAMTDGAEWDASAVFDCERTESLQTALEVARSMAPDIVIVDADVLHAMDLVEALVDDPLTEPTPIVVVGTFPNEGAASRFIALGVAKTLPKPLVAEKLRSICSEAAQRAEGPRLQTALGEPTIEELATRLADEVKQALAVDPGSRSRKVLLGDGAEVLGAIWGAIARVREVVTAKTNGQVRFAGGPGGAIALAPWLHAEAPTDERRGGRGEVHLSGKKVVVADDDPGVTWFVADLLRQAGCVVHEALDGVSALELCYSISPDLVVSDILMPGIDGFALCRALKRDVALRDTPVVLLSWKEDLLQRVRELGASAAAYLRKESDARVIVARVREVLRPRSRFEARLVSASEVRGRLDGLTVRSLLEVACATRANARVSVHDASFLYEVEIRESAPKSATRTAGDGSFVRGEKILAAMLGVGAGRFAITPSDAPVNGELRGSLAEQIARPIAFARGAMSVVTGAHVMSVRRIEIDRDALSAYLLATPGPARRILERLANGATPREILLAGDVEPSLVDEVLGDLASRGAIVGVFSGEEDLLTPAVERAMRAMSSAKQDAPSSIRPGSARPSRTSLRAAPPLALLATDVFAQQLRSGLTPIPNAGTSPKGPPAPGTSTHDTADASSSAKTKVADAPRDEPPTPRGIIFGDTPLSPEVTAKRAPDEISGPSIPVDFSEPKIVDLPREESDSDLDRTAPDRHKRAAIERHERDVAARRKNLVEARPEPAKRSTWPLLLVAIVFLAGIWYANRSSSNEANSAADAHAAASATHNPIVPSAQPGVSEGDVPPGVVLKEGQGYLEVTGAGHAQIRLDGFNKGDGPTLKMPAWPGAHDVRLMSTTGERARFVEVQANRSTRVDFSQGQ